MNWKAGLVIGVLLAVGAAWYLSRSTSTDTPDAAATTAPAGPIARSEPAPAPIEGDAPLVPPPPTLDASDAAVQQVFADLSPQLSQWLVPEAQVRRWVALVDQLADGALPDRRPLNFPMSAFAVRRDGDKLLPDPSSYARATALIDAVTAIPPARVGPYYRAWYPRLEEAYRELGRGEGFDKRLHLALQRVIAVKPLPAPPALARPVVFYTYADSRYENASELEKLLWRLGPDNMQRVQNYARELEQAL